MEHKDRIELTRLLATYGVRPIVDELANIVEQNEKAKYSCDVDEDSMWLDEGDKHICVCNLRRDLF
jgi:hypothetical protein